METLQETLQDNTRIYGFDTNNKDYASAALILYSIYRSRNTKKFSSKVKKDYWGRVEEFTKKAARGSTTIVRLIDKLKKEFECTQIYKMFMNSDLGSYKIAIIDELTGKIIIPNQQEVSIYLTTLIKHLDDRNIINIMRFESSYIVLLVQERIDNEKILEQRGFITTKVEEDNEEENEEEEN